MDLKLKGKVAIITGAAQGLGKAIAKTFIDEGAFVVLSDINEEFGQKALKEICPDKQMAIFVKTDVSSEQDIDNLLKASLDKFKKINILINNAGICPRTAFEDISADEWDKVLAVNLRSVFLLSQKVFKYMKQNPGGKIINMASGAGKVGGVQVGAHYSASKAAVICLTKTIALNGAQYGINANAVCPGVIATEMTMNISKEQLEKYKQMIPLGRMGTPQDVADTVVFLASQRADYITGEISDVNGGFIMD